MDISRPCQPEKLIPLLPWPGFDPSFSGHNDRPAITSEWTRLRLKPLSHRGWHCPAVSSWLIVLMCRLQPQWRDPYHLWVLLWTIRPRSQWVTLSHSAVEPDPLVTSKFPLEQALNASLLEGGGVPLSIVQAMKPYFASFGSQSRLGPLDPLISHYTGCGWTWWPISRTI